MTPTRLLALSVALVLVVSLNRPDAKAAQAQAGCQPPPLAASTAPNIFSPQQEIEFGEIQAELVEPSFLIVDDEALTKPIADIGQKLIAHLPPPGLRVKF